jgi:peptide deformylase
MAILNILEFPDPRLRTIAKPVAVVDDEVRQLVDDMFETMYEAPASALPRPRSTCTNVSS